MAALRTTVLLLCLTALASADETGTEVKISEVKEEDGDLASDTSTGLGYPLAAYQLAANPLAAYQLAANPLAAYQLVAAPASGYGKTAFVIPIFNYGFGLSGHPGYEHPGYYGFGSDGHLRLGSGYAHYDSPYLSYSSYYGSHGHRHRHGAYNKY